MAYRDSPFQELKVPLTWTAGAATIIALGLAVLLYTSDRKDQAKVNAQALGHAQIRAGFDGVMAPVSGVLAAPMRWINDGAGAVGGYFFAVSENKRLKKRVAELEQLQASDVALRNLNRRYEELLKLRTEPPIPMVTARVVTDTRGPFSNARLIDAGTNQGVKIGNPAMTEQGVAGRIVGVSANASRLLLLTDPESRTPVLIDRTNARAVLTGDGGSNPRLDYLRGKDAVKNGDLVLTSGDGGLYPRGLPVGVAIQDLRGVWRIRAYSDRAAIDFVRILVFDDFSQMVNQARLAEPAMPPLDAAAAAQVKAAAEKPPTPPTFTQPKPGVTTAAPPAPTPAPVAAAPMAVPPPAAKPSIAKLPVKPPVAAAQPTPKPQAAATAPAKPATAKPASAVKKPAPKLAPGQYKRVHTPFRPPVDGLPQYDPNYPQGRNPGGAG